MAQKFIIEMTLPDDVDPSDLLDRMQEIAVDIHEEFPTLDDEGDEVDLDEDAKEEIRQEVAVITVTEEEKAA